MCQPHLSHQFTLGTALANVTKDLLLMANPRDTFQASSCYWFKAHVPYALKDQNSKRLSLE